MNGPQLKKRKAFLQFKYLGRLSILTFIKGFVQNKRSLPADWLVTA